MLRQYQLVEKIKSYDPDADEELINRAYIYCMKMHGSQKRASGDPYFQHPIEVAGLLSDMRLDTNSIVTGLLHDTIEDTTATKEEIAKAFNAEIADLVNGVTKLTQLELKKQSDKQAENFQKLIIAVSHDIRVLLVKLCDRLHNMRTLGAIQKQEKRERIAQETREIYAPLAEKIGIHSIQEELENLAFLHLEPSEYQAIVDNLTKLRDQQTKDLDRTIAELNQMCADNQIKAVITGREKSPYSIWRKMQRKQMEFQQLYDIIAFRITTDTIAECYQILGLIHNHYTAIPGRFKDYISTPKSNGYRSLHTTVIDQEGHRMEIQIRTHQMHEVAELGVAAHWVYKQNSRKRNHEKNPQYRWIRELLDIMDTAQKPEEFLEHTKMELFDDQVFCFTPQGDVLALPVGATPVDFAYAVHSQVGDHCHGAKINGKIVPLRAQLQNGDQIEILTNKNAQPSPEWERFVITGKAKARIRRFIRLKQNDEYIALGKAILQRQAKQDQLVYHEADFTKLTGKFKFDHLDQFYVAVGKGHIGPREALQAAFPHHPPYVGERKTKFIPLFRSRRQKKATKVEPVSIAGLIGGMAIHYAKCCHPIPGDAITGIVATGKGVTIHRQDCNSLSKIKDKNRFLDVAWHDQGETPPYYVGRLKCMLLNKPGALGLLTTMIGKGGGNISNLKFTQRGIDFFEILLDLEVTDTRHLEQISAMLRGMTQITMVKRVD